MAWLGSLLACVGSDTATVAPPAPTEPPPAPAEVEPAEPPEPEIGVEDARSLLFPEGAPESASCPAPDAVRCLIRARYAGHPSEQAQALALYDEMGDVAGLETEQDFDGGFRGIIHLVPELPVGQHGRHLAWVLSAQRQIDRFLSDLSARATRPVTYRHRAIGWRFTRSVRRATPSAYASQWQIGYNVSGSLLRSEAEVLGTVFHEMLHLNDQAHGGWSRRTLGKIVDGIAAKCGTEASCLAPYSPSALRVRGGTYYAFQPGNGDIANEYAAELASRYYIEQTAMMKGEPPRDPFVCGPPENALAMRALADELFGGVLLAPPCAP